MNFKIWLEAMQEQLPDDVFIGIHNYSPTKTVIYFSDQEGKELRNDQPIWGFIALEKNEECKFWVVELSNAAKGYGPLLYELAMEYTSLPRNGGGGLASDRLHVDPSAIRVWQNFFKRQDVHKLPINDEYCGDLSFQHTPEDTKVLNYSYVKQPTTRLQLLKNKIIRRFMKAPLQAITRYVPS